MGSWAQDYMSDNPPGGPSAGARGLLLRSKVSYAAPSLFLRAIDYVR